MQPRTLSYLLLAALWLLAPQFATAASKGTVDALSKRFATLGAVRYQQFAPLGGPEVGVAEVGSGSATRLVAQRAGDSGDVNTLIDEPFASTGGGPDFALLAGGAHLLAYHSQPWTAADGS